MLRSALLALLTLSPPVYAELSPGDVEAGFTLWKIEDGDGDRLGVVIAIGSSGYEAGDQSWPANHAYWYWEKPKEGGGVEHCVVDKAQAWPDSFRLRLMSADDATPAASHAGWALGQGAIKDCAPDTKHVFMDTSQGLNFESSYTIEDNKDAPYTLYKVTHAALYSATDMTSYPAQAAWVKTPPSGSYAAWSCEGADPASMKWYIKPKKVNKTRPKPSEEVLFTTPSADTTLVFEAQAHDGPWSQTEKKLWIRADQPSECG